MTISCKNQQFANIQGIIFDKDGTLENSQNYLRELGIRRSRLIDAQIPGVGDPLLMAFGIQDDKIDPAGLMAVGSRQENQIAAAAYIAETGRGWFESLAIAGNAFEEADRYLQKKPSTSPLFTSCLETLKELAEAGLKLAILSADSTPNVQKFIQVHQLSNYIHLAMGADQGLSKPDPALYLKTCASLGIDPQYTLMIGDSQGDMEMGKKAGAAGVIGICWHNPAASHLEPADVLIEQLDQLKITNSAN